MLYKQQIRLRPHLLSNPAFMAGFFVFRMFSIKTVIAPLKLVDIITPLIIIKLLIKTMI